MISLQTKIAYMLTSLNGQVSDASERETENYINFSTPVCLQGMFSMFKD